MIVGQLLTPDIPDAVAKVVISRAELNNLVNNLVNASQRLAVFAIMNSTVTIRVYDVVCEASATSAMVSSVVQPFFIFGSVKLKIDIGEKLVANEVIYIGRDAMYHH